MTKITDTTQADRLYKAIVKDGWAAELEPIDDGEYLARIYNENNHLVETHVLEMTDDAADVWLAGGIG